MSFFGKEPTQLFFWIVYLFLGAVWFVAVRAGAVAFVLLFTALMLVHGVLHGLLPRFQQAGRSIWYMAVQLVLASLLVVLSGKSPLSPALFFPVVGEAFGLFTSLRGRLIAMAAGVAAWIGTVAVALGAETLRVQAPSAVAALAFVAVYVTLFTRQTLERQRAEQLLAQLEDAHRQLRAYDARLEELTIGQERQRMARELHDTLAQGLAGIIMQMDSVDELLERGDVAKARAIVDRARQRARNALADARAVIQALRAPLDDLNVVEAIRRQVETLRADSGIACALEIGPGDVAALDGELGRQVLRISQEGLVNVAKHSHAGQATVHLWAGPDQIELEITDDGLGFDPGQAVGKPGHFGLMGLQERVRLTGGELRIESSPGRGTRLYARLPKEV